jgi:hypothetical protein
LGAPAQSRLFDDLDPEKATTIGEFAALLQDVRIRSGKTYDDLNRWAEERGTTLAKSTLHDLFKGQRLPRDGHMVAILLGCGLEPAALEPWKRSRSHLAKPQQDVVVLKNDLHDLNGELRDRLADVQREVDRLKTREQELAARLAGEEVKCRQLKEELERLHNARTSTLARESNEQLAQYHELKVLHEREREHIESMRGELVELSNERRHAEQQAELVAAESNDAERTTRVIDLLELHFERAEYERRQRETLTSRLEEAHTRIAELQHVLALYQGSVPHRDEQTPAPTCQPVAGMANDHHHSVKPMSWWRRVFIRASGKS